MNRIEHRVVVVGCGFGGLICRSRADEALRTTVIDRNNHHLFQPLLYRMATGILAEGDITSASDILRHQRNARLRRRARMMSRGHPPQASRPDAIALWLAWTLALGLSFPLRAQTPLSFRDALTVAQQHNQQLRAADAQVERSRSDRAAERGPLFPDGQRDRRLRPHERSAVRGPQRPPAAALRAQPGGADSPPHRDRAGERSVPRQHYRAVDRVRGRQDPRGQPGRSGGRDRGRAGAPRRRQVASPRSWWTATSSAGWPPTCWRSDDRPSRPSADIWTMRTG